MDGNWAAADEALRQVVVTGNERNEEVIVTSVPASLSCIGIGTDAAVFASAHAPGYAYKVYSDLAVGKKEVERQVYELLHGIPYFPVYYGEGANYIVISRERGITLTDCLIEGIPVPEQVIQDVEEARELVRRRGLNPRDIHLKNVLLQDGRAKVLDVSEYVQEGDDKRWEHLVWAYRTFYPSLEGRKIPAWILDMVKNGYMKLDQANINLDELGQRVSRLLEKLTK
jgi:hypothetical protein